MTGKWKGSAILRQAQDSVLRPFGRLRTTQAQDTACSGQRKLRAAQAQDTALVGRLILILLFCCLIGVSGCVSHIHKLRVAQDQFSKAAYMDNLSKLGDPKAALLAEGDATSSYTMAMQIVSDLIKNHKGSLEKDKLLGTAYTIKAMSEWRLGEFPNAMETVSLALDTPGQSIFPRDRTLLEALRGLIKNDQAFSHMMRRNYPYSRTKTLLKDALSNLKSALMKAPKGSKIRLYILVSELAVLKNWADLRGNPAKYSLSVPRGFDKAKEINDWCKIAAPAWKEFAEEATRFGDAGKQLVVDWGRRLGMPESCR